MVGHDGDVPSPVQMVVDVYTKVMEVRHCGDVIGA